MDESSLRNYFRKALGVPPGASRKELKLSRDKRAQRWRTMLAAPGAEQTEEGLAAAKLAEEGLAITNSAYDCLSNADKFRDWQSRLASGEELPDLDKLLPSLGEDNVKPVAARVLAKRQAQLQEKIERITVLATESVIKAGHDQALKLTQGKLPNADVFYDSVYKAARDAGNRTCVEEMSQLAQSKLEMDETFKSDLEGLVIDQAEIIAHKEYDRLEDRAAASAPTPAMPRFVALTLSLIIMGLVVSMCLYGATSPPTPVPVSQYQAPVAAPAPVAAVPAPVPGIANSVFNRSTFGGPNDNTPAPAVPPTAALPTTAGQATGVPSAATPATATPATAAPAGAPTAGFPGFANTPGAPDASVAPATVIVSLDEVKKAEQVTVTSSEVPDPAVAVAAGLVPTAGNAGMAGMPNSYGKPGATVYGTAVTAGLGGSLDESVRGFRQAYATGHFKEALYNEAVLLGVQGRYQASLDAYNKLLTAHPAFPQGLYNRALMHQSLANAAWRAKNSADWQRHLLMAVANYDLALKADPRMSQAFFNLGIAQYQLNQKEKAYSDFALATSLVPRFMPAADYNQEVVGLVLKKSTPPPAATAPPCPIGPVGPAGPP